MLRGFFRRLFNRCPECGKKLVRIELAMGAVFLEFACAEIHYAEMFVAPDLSRTIIFRGEDAREAILDFTETCERQLATWNWLIAPVKDKTLH